MNREQKAQSVSSIKKALLESSLVVLLHYRGLKDNELYNFRTALKEKNTNLKVAKNTLVKIAIKDTDLNVLEPYLNGPVAIAYGEDAASLAKVTTDNAKKYEALEIQTGYLNKSLLSKDAIDSLSKLGSLEDVRASFISRLKGAQSSFVRILNAPASKTVALINNYVSSKE